MEIPAGTPGTFHVIDEAIFLHYDVLGDEVQWYQDIRSNE
jgi:hypothetical protein